MKNDLIHYVCIRAARKFDATGNSRLFNGANFSAAWSEVTGLLGGLDGYAVEAMLHGREDVAVDGLAHYRLRSEPFS